MPEIDISYMEVIGSWSIASAVLNTANRDIVFRETTVADFDNNLSYPGTSLAFNPSPY